MVSVESEKRHYAFDNGQLVRSMPARFGGHYWDAVKEEAGYGTTPKGLFSIGIMQADMVSNLFEAEMPHSMCFAGGALYCIHGSPMFDAYGYTHPHVEGEAGSAGCINLHTWDAEWLFDWVEPGMPLLVQTDM